MSVAMYSMIKTCHDIVVPRILVVNNMRVAQQK